MSTPTNYEQEHLEYINQARMDPDGEYDRLVTNASSDVQNAINFFNVDLNVLQMQFAALTPVAPLAWNEQLAEAADTHSQLMIDNDEQSHNLPGEAGLLARIQATGYGTTGSVRVAENIFAFAETPYYDHAAFFIDWGNTTTGIQDPPGHRNTIMNGALTEVGISAIPENNSSTSVGPYVVTQNFGGRSPYDPQLVGVVFDDADNDDFYDAGEGLEGITVTASGSAGTFTTTTWSSGGYQMALPAGSYTVTFSGFTGSDAGMEASDTITIGSENVKMDANADDDLTSGSGGGSGGGSSGLSATTGNDNVTGTSAGEELDLLAGNDTFLGSGGDDTMLGNSGNDRLWGGPGADEIDGGSGNDAMGGGDDNDTLTGGDGDDTMSGAGGDDSVSGEGGSDKAFGDGGNDTVSGNDDDDTIGGGTGDDLVQGGDGRDQVWGADGSDLVWGGGLGDTVDGGAGNDRVGGDDGWDKVWGNDGDDTLYGGNGNDTIGGGAGNDVATGAAGEDVFAFYSLNSGENDTITDFTLDEDVILMGGVAGSGDAAKFANLSISGTTDAVITYDGHSITLTGVSAASLDENDFVFV